MVEAVPEEVPEAEAEEAGRGDVFFKIWNKKFQFERQTKTKLIKILAKLSKNEYNISEKHI